MPVGLSLGSLFDRVLPSHFIRLVSIASGSRCEPNLRTCCTSPCLAMQGPEPAHSAMLADYMRHNIGHLLKPQHGKHAEELVQESSQPELPAEPSGQEQAKARTFHFVLVV